MTPARPRRARLHLSLSIAALALAATAGQSMAQTAVYPVVVGNAADPLFANLTIPANAATAGMWSGMKDWPMIAIHSALLPDGRVLTFGAAQGGQGQDGRTLAFWDPRKGFDQSAFLVLPNAQNVDSFCASATLLNDGKLLTSGGTSGASGFSSRESMVMDWRSSAATRDYDLNAPRWYGTMTKLPDGRAIITGGGSPYPGFGPDRPDAANDISSTPEVYTPGKGWASLIGAYSTDAFGAKNTRWWYPRQWVSPAGTLFGVSTEKMWEMKLDGNGSIRTLRDFKTAVNNDTKPNVGATSTAVMYDTGKILQVGGNGYFNGYGSPSSNLATTFDITAIGNGRVDVADTKPMTYARQWATAVVLPNGRVMVEGGSTYADQGGDNAVLPVEIWDAATGNWTVGAAAAVYRGYHSTALLLPDGAVLTAGGGAPGPVNNLNAQIYYPPYLFQQANGGSVLAARPRIVSLSTVTGGYNQTIDIQTATGDTVSEVSLIANGSVTHSFDSNQRRLKLSFTQTNNGVKVAMPTSANLAPPGYYTLSVLNNARVPSVGVTVSLGAAAPLAPSDAVPAPQRAAPTLVAGTSIKFEPAARPGYLLRHFNYLGTIGQITSASGAVDQADASFIVRQGRSNTGCYSFESTNFAGFFLQHENFRIKIKAGDAGDVSLRGTTFCARAALNGSTATTDISFESIDWPGYYIGLVNNDVSIVKHDGSATSAANLTFRTSAAGLIPTAAVSMQPVTWPGYLWRHQGYVGYIAQIGNASQQIDKLDASFFTRAGLANGKCVSFESKNFPGYYLRSQNQRLNLVKNDGSDAALKDSTFCVRPALNGATDMGVVSLESLSSPGYYIRHQNFGLFIIKDDGSNNAKTDTSFVVVAPPQ